jgi:hypothetical protein
MRRMAADLTISNTFLRKWPKMKPSVRVKVLLLTQHQKRTQHKRSKAILNDVKDGADERAIISTIEKILIVDAATNRRNEGRIDSDPLNCPTGVKYIKTTKDT